MKAGTATASTAPLKFTAGTVLTSPENGAFEYDGTNYYLTIGTTRLAIPLAGGSASYSSINAGAGTAAAPSHSFTGDLDTGIFSSGADSIGLAAGGSKVFDVSSAGLVSPTTGGASVASANGTAATPTYSFAGDLGTGWFRAAASTLAASTGGTEKLRITPAGYLGIGTTAPVGTLEVAGGTAAASTDGSSIKLTAQSAGAGGNNSGGHILLYAGAKTGSGQVGSVGVGATPPSWMQANSLIVAGQLYSNTSIGSSGAINSSASGTFPIVYGGTGASGVLTIDSTSHATKGNINLAPSGGNVGIGTTAPGTLLSNHASNTVDAAGAGHSTSALDWSANSTGYVGAFFNASSAAAANGVLIKGAGTASTNALLSVDSGSTQNSGGSALFRVLGNGNVGIGTTAPAAKLQVVGSSNYGTAEIVGSTADSETAIGFRATNVARGSAGNFVIGANLAGMPVGSFGIFAAPAAKAITLLSNGNLGIGVLNPTYLLQLGTDSAAKPGTSTWTIASDERLKDIRAPFTRGLSDLEKLHTIYFRYKAHNPLDLPSEKEYVGIRAQDAEKAIPESVSRDEKGYLHVTND
ncbi:MAG: tail fiber domain-containing protein, partial [Proteobacteria bacterium]